MKFCKRYEEYMRGREKELPAVGLKKLKKILKRCRREFHSRQDGGGGKCPDNCAVCDGAFFSSLLNEMSAVVGCFNQRAQKLLELHLASGFKKYIMWFRGKSLQSHGELRQEGKDLVAYGIINSIAMRKILKKYDKIHFSKQGQAFRSKAPSMHIEILQSPWLSELMAFYINLRQSTDKNNSMAELLDDCFLTFDDEAKPTLSCSLFDSMKIEIDLTCSICLETVFDPVALTCGHLLCYMCSCSAASVTIVDGLKAANCKSKCPLCRQEGVYQGAVHLDELNILLRHSCPDYWQKRRQIERVERVHQAKKHWESVSRDFLGI
ncbi:putative E3 ubiquitin-protein ligase BAH1-like 1 [Curcuma longa]|uniref:putative E3 ubiquitin-protein ligase BAH1-like 1 n=1 Tax=Curcuma longa TaxID=136217 RepID=UPI003D9E0B34